MIPCDETSWMRKMTRDPTISQGLACSLFERLSTKATFEAGSAIAIPEAARDVTGQDLSPTRKIDNTCFFVKKNNPNIFCSCLAWAGSLHWAEEPCFSFTSASHSVWQLASAMSMIYLCCSNQETGAQRNAYPLALQQCSSVQL